MVDTREESRFRQFRLDIQALAHGIDRHGFFITVDRTVILLGFDRRVLGKGVDAFGLFYLVIDVLCDVSRGDLTRKLRFFLLVRGLGRRDVRIIRTLPVGILEENVARPFCRRRSKPLVDFNGAFELALAILIVCICQLVCEGVEHIFDVAVVDLGAGIRAQCDMRIVFCLCDLDIAALDRRRRRRIMLEDEARIAAVVVDEDVFFTLPHDACMRRGVAARELRQMRCGEAGSVY